MSFFIDLILVAVILISVIVGWKKGFVKSFMGLISFSASLILTWIFYNPLAKILYDKFFLDAISKYIKNAFLREIGGSGQSLADLFAELPDIFTAFINRFSTTNDATAFFTKNANATAAEFSRFLAEPIADTVSKVVSFIGLFIAIFIAIKLLTLLLDKVVKSPLLNSVNTLLGVLLGALLGLFFAWVLAIVFEAILPKLAMLFPKLFKENTADTTIIMRFLYNFNLFKIIQLFKF